MKKIQQYILTILFVTVAGCDSSPQIQNSTKEIELLKTSLGLTAVDKLSMAFIADGANKEIEGIDEQQLLHHLAALKWQPAKPGSILPSMEMWKITVWDQGEVVSEIEVLPLQVSHRFYNVRTEQWADSKAWCQLLKKVVESDPTYWEKALSPYYRHLSHPCWNELFPTPAVQPPEPN